MRAMLTAAAVSFALPRVRALRPAGESILVSLLRLGVFLNVQVRTSEPAQS